MTSLFIACRVRPWEEYAFMSSSNDDFLERRSEPFRGKCFTELYKRFHTAHYFNSFYIDLIYELYHLDYLTVHLKRKNINGTGKTFFKL